MRRQLATSALLLAAVLAVSGCGSDQIKTARVEGKVTYKGKPVPNGTVTFVPDGKGPSATGEIQSDGTYTLTTYSQGDGAILGSHKVMIVALREAPQNALPEDRNPLPPPIIPDRYMNTATSNLTAEVKDEDNTIVFELTDELPGKGR